MKAGVLHEGRLHEQDVPVPHYGSDEILVEVAYAGVNRADLYQSLGQYPLPEAPAVPGLELSGWVCGVGERVQHFKPGDEVCALVSQGAYAQYCIVPAAQAMLIPEGWNLQEAAALMEGLFTSWISLMEHGRLQPGETVLIHGAASGIGHIAVQMALVLGAKVYATAGSEKKCAAIRARYGVSMINYREESFADVILESTDGQGVDVVMDMVGAPYLTDHLRILAHGGRLSIIALQAGARAELSLTPLLLKQLSIYGSILRSRSAEEKFRLQQNIVTALGEALRSKSINPMIDSVFSLDKAEKAWEHMHQGLNIGKILLSVSPVSR